VPFECREWNGVLVIAAIGTIRFEDVPELYKAEQAFLSTPGRRALFLCDCSRMKVISPEARDVLMELMHHDTPLLDRAAYVVGTGVNALQLTRMIAEAGSPKRRAFGDEAEAMRWLIATPEAGDRS
jgi:hypothetical protein